jgi:hypothetical protein
MDAKYADRFPADMSEYFVSRWSRVEIWGLDLPVHMLSTVSLSWHLDYPFWSSQPPKALCDLCPRVVLQRPGAYPEHDKRILEANAGFPLDLGLFGSRWIILDGIHRLVKLVANGTLALRVRRVPQRYIRRELE